MTRAVTVEHGLFQKQREAGRGLRIIFAASNKISR